MATIRTKKSDIYIPSKTADLYPQLRPTEAGSYLRSKLSDNEPDVDSATKQRKYFRFVVDDNKPMCVTLLGLDDGVEDVTLVVDQLFGPPNCETRKPVKGAFFSADVCQLIFNKPGSYEIRETDMGLFPVGAQVRVRVISTDTARLLGEKGSVFSL